MTSSRWTALAACALWIGCNAGDPSGGADGGGTPSGPWDLGVHVPAEPQAGGDPVAGRHALLHEGYISCGIPYSLFSLAGGPLGGLADGEPLPDRDGKNANVPYNWTVHTAPSGVEVVSQNCLGCHAERFNGELVVGLGNNTTDYTESMASRLEGFEVSDDAEPGTDLGELSKFIRRVRTLGEPTAMRTVGTNPAEMIAVTLVAHRDRHTLEWSDEPLEPIPQVAVPSDPPPWWRAHKKHALFYNAMARGDHRGTMMLATSLCTDSIDEARAILGYFDDIHAYIRSLRAPAYPFAIDDAVAAQGAAIFADDCAGCHGTYGDTDADDTYPNLLFPLEVIGTDPVVALGGVSYAPHMVEWYNESFYGTVTRMVPDDPFPGYMAPPLDGVWATGPFLHNGSVPTIELVLDSAARPTFWRRVDYDSANFDQEALGWPYEALPYGQLEAPEAERKYIYDTTLEAHANQGHTFGDHLTDAERRAVLEYLKTL